MEYIPIKTRIMHPPKDDLFSVFDEYLTDVHEGDIICISSKVVAIHQGRCVPIEGTDRLALAKQEADLVIERAYQQTPLFIKEGTFISSSGIDASNANGYLVLMPEDMFAFAKEVRNYLREKHAVKHIGIIITDSRSLPLRYGATGVSLAFYGLQPLLDHRGRKDLFGRMIQHERSNIVDGIASGANVVMGEVDESTPIVIVRGVSSAVFTEENSKEELFTGFQEDSFRVLYDRHIT